ncbi:ROK family protein [Thaumasiovibrio subtropicus]|uniref:ROK family protein n=1 Tax=Thaumasiovibrio subtropicus TaxID=1891207 RepID=UPI000B353C23|nr:ROK family protein [Thaumasiovibrio subtropicus]
MQNYYWGVDLGGTKIECAVMDRETDECILRERTPTEGDQGYRHVLDNIRNLIESCAEKVGEYPDIIGFGTPGTIDPQSGVMKNCNSTHLNGQPLDKDLQILLDCEVKLANDANCFALAEARLGAVQDVDPDAKVVFGVILGTGVGAGIVVNGELINGHHGIGGEWGHNTLVHDDGVDCYCGKSGCVETVIAGPSLERFYFELTGEKRSLKSIAQGAEEGEGLCRHTLTHLVEHFGQAVSVVINILDPDVIVIGGGVGNIDALYDYAPAAIKKHIFNPDVATKLVKPKLGDSAGVFGAAMLVK